MKKLWKHILFAFLLSGLIFFGESNVAQVKAAPKLNKKSASITIGQAIKLNVKRTKKKVKWSSTNRSVASVSKTGLVKGKRAGKATIKAKIGSKVLRCNIKVMAKKKPNSKPNQKPNSRPTTVAPTKLTVTSPWKILPPNGTMQLSLGYFPANAEKQAVKWYSSNEGIAKVSSSGFVTTTNRGGDVTITAVLASNSQIKGSFTFTIKGWVIEYENLSKDGGDLLLSEDSSRALFKYSLLEFAVPDTRVQVLDSVGNVIQTWTTGPIGQNVKKTIEWDLKDSAGNKVPAGSYSFQVSAANAMLECGSIVIYASSDFSKGNGSPNSPYEVSTLEDLKKVGFHNGRHFKQTADIDVELKAITPLFTTDKPFTGTYDGGNHSIKNVITTIEDGVNVGIFKAVGKEGCLKNMIIEDSSFTGKENVAALAGTNDGTVDGCVVKNCNFVASGVKAGSIAAYNSGNGKILRCNTESNTVTIQTSSSSESGVGGISGYNNGTIARCTGEGDNISLTAQYQQAGGIVGNNKGIVKDCTIKSAVLKGVSLSSANYGGGIAGFNDGSVINSSVEDLTVDGTWTRKGGIIGNNNGNSANNTYVGPLNQEGNK